MGRGKYIQDGKLYDKKADFEEKINRISANILKKTIKSSGKSVETIEKELKAAGTPISYSTLYNYMSSGIATPYALTVLAKYFGTTTDYFLGLSETSSLDIEIQAIGKKTGLSGPAIEQIIVMKELDEQPPRPGQLKMLNRILEHMIDFSGLLAQMQLYLREVNSEPPHMNHYSKKVSKKEPTVQPPYDALFLSEELRKMGYVVTTPKEFSRMKFEDCIEMLKKMLDKMACEQKEDDK